MNILFHTPLWVYILFFCLLALGLLQTRDRLVRQRTAFLMPVAMIGFSFLGLHSTFGLSTLSLVPWLASLTFSALIARRSFLRTALSFDSQHKQFFIPGSMMPLAVIMAIFLTKYAMAVSQARMGEVFSTTCTLGLSAFLGACSGYFVARPLALRYVAKRPMTR
ncbi:DUF6622 family protein [Alcaligenes aquatilis]|uniref:DUF6622 family protein n=1 Tax=Alcaligenes aquatilis TaxID=323284 RepID=UPI003F8F9703